MKSKAAFLIIILLSFSIFLAGCETTPSKTADTTKTTDTTKIVTESTEDKTAEKPFGGKKDEYGCVLKDGYSWCDALKKCIQAAEEKCERPADYKTPPSGYYTIRNALAKKNKMLINEFNLGIKSLQKAHFRGVVSGKEGIILAVKENNDWIIVVDTVYGTEKTYTCKEVEEHYFPAELITDCLTE